MTFKELKKGITMMSEKLGYTFIFVTYIEENVLSRVDYYRQEILVLETLKGKTLIKIMCTQYFKLLSGRVSDYHLHGKHKYENEVCAIMELLDRREGVLNNVNRY